MNANHIIRFGIVALISTSLFTGCVNTGGNIGGKIESLPYDKGNAIVLEEELGPNGEVVGGKRTTKTPLAANLEVNHIRGDVAKASFGRPAMVVPQGNPGYAPGYIPTFFGGGNPGYPLNGNGGGAVITPVGNGMVNMTTPPAYGGFISPGGGGYIR